METGSLDPFRLAIQVASTGNFESNDALADQLAELFPAPAEDYQPPVTFQAPLLPQNANNLLGITPQVPQQGQPQGVPQQPLPAPRLSVPVGQDQTNSIGSILSGGVPDNLQALLPALQSFMNPKARQGQAPASQQDALSSELGLLLGSGG